MKSLKSLFALLAIVTLSFGCASVTDASLDEQPADDQITAPAESPVFSGGNGVEPIIEKPDV